MWPDTLWDEGGDLLRSAAVFPGAVFRPTMSVRAPCCGRCTSADAVIDARSVAGTVVRGVDLDWLCDGCWTRMVRDSSNGWTRSRWWRALGADANTIRQHRARELAEERTRAAADRGEPYQRHEEIQRALDELPEGVRDLPGTEPPQ